MLGAERGRRRSQREEHREHRDKKKRKEGRTRCPIVGVGAWEEEADPSTARPDAPENGAKEKIGPLRSG